MFRVFRNNFHAIVPQRAKEGDAGYDLSSVEDVIIPPHSQAIVDTGLIFDIPNDCYARVAPRSGLAAKNSIDVLAGVVDSGYRSNIKVILYNHSEKEFAIKVGDRIAQVIFERIYTPILSEVSLLSQLSDSERGQGGFGSSGI
jgi:dUTP pyrophosphatase